MPKKTNKLNLSINYTPKYAIVDEKGNILEKFRIRCTAHSMLKYYKDNYFPMELKIVKL
jgi:hypothetical protein